MKITFSAPFNHTVKEKKFKLFTLIPTLEFVIDKQGTPYVKGDGKAEEGWDEYSLGFIWLIFAFWIEFNFVKRLPTHYERELLSCPGDTIEETMQAMNIPDTVMAGKLGVDLIHFQGLIKGRDPITEGIASRLEKITNVPTEFWINREKNYREKLKVIEQKEEQYYANTKHK